MHTTQTTVAAHALALMGGVVLESLTIAPDAMPHHHVARAVILDLEPSQMVAAIMCVEAEIRKTYRHAYRTGWRATNDGLTVFFHAHVWGEYQRRQQQRELQ